MPALEEVVLMLARSLRQAGVAVGPAEVADCCLAMSLLPGGPERLALAAEATLAKNRREREVLRQVLALQRACSAARDAGSGFPARESAGAGAAAAPEGGLAPGLWETVLAGEPADLEALARRAARALPEPAPEDLRRPAAYLRRAMVALEWFMVEHRLEQARPELGESAYQAARRRLEALRELLRAETQARIARHYGEEGLREVLQSMDLEGADLDSLEEDQVAEIRRRIAGWGRRLASRRAAGWERGRGREIDLGRTVRRAMATGGVPLRLARRRHPLARPELVLLCDVSPSVSQYASFMLQLVYTLQRRFRHVRSFVFVDAVDEVTGFFQGEDPLRAVERVRRVARSTVAGVSDFGRAFADFNRRYEEAVNRRSTVCILGDARNNWRDPRPEELARLAARARRVYWLNPRPRDAWWGGDSVLAAYAPYCREVLECRNLRQLEEATRHLV